MFAFFFVVDCGLRHLQSNRNLAITMLYNKNMIFISFLIVKKMKKSGQWSCWPLKKISRFNILAVYSLESLNAIFSQKGKAHKNLNSTRAEAKSVGYLLIFWACRKPLSRINRLLPESSLQSQRKDKKIKSQIGIWFIQRTSWSFVVYKACILLSILLRLTTCFKYAARVSTPDMEHRHNPWCHTSGAVLIKHW